MKNKSKVEKIYSDAAEALAKSFVSPSILVYFLSSLADIVYEYKLEDSSHSITLRVLRAIAEPWISNDLWDVALNLREVHDDFGYSEFHDWITIAISTHAKADFEGCSNGFSMSANIEYYAALYALAEAFENAEIDQAQEKHKQAA